MQSPFFLRFQVFVRHVFRREYLSLGLILAGLGITLYGLNQLSTGTPELNSSALSQEVDQTEPLVPTVLVEVAGAVKEPGVYGVSATARVGEAIEQAGGLSEVADTTFVARELQLAQSVVDGEKIYIPFTGEFTPITVSKSTDQVEQQSSGISINTASEKELQTLKGIGAVRAAAIIAQRPYTAIEQLVAREVVSQAVFDAIAPQLQL